MENSRGLKYRAATSKRTSIQLKLKYEVLIIYEAEFKFAMERHAEFKVQHQANNSRQAFILT